jgi:hypothetical protein
MGDLEERLQVMLRIVSSVVAVAAIMAIPFTQAEAGKNGGHSSGHSGGSRMSMGSSHMGSGPRVGNFSTIHSSNRIGSQKIIIGDRRHHHRGRFFVGGYGYSYGLYDTCWRWVPTAYGLRRVWVCDPYSYY